MLTGSADITADNIIEGRINLNVPRRNVAPSPPPGAIPEAGDSGVGLGTNAGNDVIANQPQAEQRDSVLPLSNQNEAPPPPLAVPHEISQPAISAAPATSQPASRAITPQHSRPGTPSRHTVMHMHPRSHGPYGTSREPYIYIDAELEACLTRVAPEPTIGRSHELWGVKKRMLEAARKYGWAVGRLAVCRAVW
jgi:hypothetical protein